MEHKVTLVVGKNGSIEVIDEDEEKNHWPELISLGLLLVTSTVLNLSVAYGILQGRARGSLGVSTLVLALCVSNTFDSIVNHTMALVFLVFWPDSSPSSTVCHWSAFFYLSALLLQPLYLTSHLLSKIFTRKQASEFLQRWFIIIPPLLAGVLPAPILVLPNLVKVRQAINRHVCCLTGESSFYSMSIIAFGFFTPWVAITYCLVARKCSCDAAHPCCIEDRELRYLFAIVLLAIILFLPAVISYSIVSVTDLDNLTTYKDSDDDIVIITGMYDTALTWARFSFDVCSSVLTLIFFDELRMECFRILLMAKAMSCRSLSSSRRQSKLVHHQGGPVLFATSRGLMLQKANFNEYSPLEKCDLMDREQMSATLQPNPPLQPLSISPVTPKVRKKWNKNTKRKIVRFAQSVKEIPHFSDD